ncbi:MAG: hypothetical protein ACOCNS_04715 [Bacteroidales bacterium]
MITHQNAIIKIYLPHQNAIIILLEPHQNAIIALAKDANNHAYPQRIFFISVANSNFQAAIFYLLPDIFPFLLDIFPFPIRKSLLQSL